MTHITTAITCFQENLQSFANTTDKAEKHNLYAGLLSTANAIEELQSEIKWLRHEISKLKNS